MKKTVDINHDGKVAWKELDVKDKIAYTMAIILIMSGIIMAFISFFRTNDITNGVLYYTAQTFVTGGALLGIGIYIKGKMGEINSYIHKQLDSK